MAEPQSICKAPVKTLSVPAEGRALDTRGPPVANGATETPKTFPTAGAVSAALVDRLRERRPVAASFFSWSSGDAYIGFFFDSAKTTKRRHREFHSLKPPVVTVTGGSVIPKVRSGNFLKVSFRAQNYRVPRFCGAV